MLLMPNQCSHAIKTCESFLAQNTNLQSSNKTEVSMSRATNTKWTSAAFEQAITSCCHGTTEYVVNADGSVETCVGQGPWFYLSYNSISVAVSPTRLPKLKTCMTAGVMREGTGTGHLPPHSLIATVLASFIMGHGVDVSDGNIAAVQCRTSGDGCCCGCSSLYDCCDQRHCRGQC